MSNDLKKCPFCGGKAYFRTTTCSSRNDIREIHFQIECRDCHVSYPKRYVLDVLMGENGEIKTLKDERKEAITAWNKRITDSRKDEDEKLHDVLCRGLSGEVIE